MSTPNDKEIDYMVGDQIVRARSYEAACAKATQPSPAAVELANKTWGEIRIALEARAKAAGVSPFNVIGIEHKFTSAGIEIDYQDKYNGKFHKTILKGWTHQ